MGSVEKYSKEWIEQKVEEIKTPNRLFVILQGLFVLLGMIVTIITLVIVVEQWDAYDSAKVWTVFSVLFLMSYLSLIYYFINGYKISSKLFLLPILIASVGFFVTMMRQNVDWTSWLMLVAAILMFASMFLQSKYIICNIAYALSLILSLVVAIYSCWEAATIIFDFSQSAPMEIFAIIIVRISMPWMAACIWTCYVLRTNFARVIEERKKYRWQLEKEAVLAKEKMNKK